MSATLTLADIRAHSPCADGWRKLLTTLGTDDMITVVSIGDVAKSNGADDALWCLRCLPDTVEVRRQAVAMILPTVKRASVHTTDPRVHDCIAAMERWQAGDDSVDLKASSSAAGEAVSAAVSAAWAEAEASAAASARKAAWAAAWAAWAAAAVASAAVAVASAAVAVASAERAAWAEASARKAAWAAAWAAGEVGEVGDPTELGRQVADIIAVSPMVALAGRART